jgi:tetrahydromethanopterin S-methyltransferase subunit G
MSTVQKIKAAISALPDADFREVSRAIDEMEAERFDRAVGEAAQLGKLEAWLKRVDADIDAGRVKPLDEVVNDA